MGLLRNTRLHLEESSTNAAVVEYHLHSWRELYDSDLITADRYSIEGGRWILGRTGDRLYRLFVVADRYYLLPQELCFQFACFEIVQDGLGREGARGYYSVSLPYETIVQDFAALISLFSRMPVVPIGLRRVGDQPRNIPPHMFTLEQFDMESRPSPVGIPSSSLVAILRGLSQADADAADAIMNALKLHHAAVTMIYFDPSIAYVMLVSAIECLAGYLYSDLTVAFEEVDKFQRLGEFLDSVDLSDSQVEALSEIKAKLARAEYHLGRKFRRFIVEFLPDDFWTIADDLYDYSAFPTILKGDLESFLKKVWGARSKNLHTGMPFPPYVDFGARKFVHPEAMPAMMQLVRTDAGDEVFVPPFSWFERLVHSCLIEYLKRQHAPELTRQDAEAKAEREQIAQLVEQLDVDQREALERLVRWTAQFIGTNLIGPWAPNRDWVDSPTIVESLKDLGLIKCNNTSLDGQSQIADREIGEALGQVFFGPERNPFRGAEVLMPRDFEL